MPDDAFAIGRHIMTCCADDIAFGGLIAKWHDANDFVSRDWVVITAKIVNEYCDIYNSKGPVLYATQVDVSLPPQEELATFY